MTARKKQLTTKLRFCDTCQAVVKKVMIGWNNKKSWLTCFQAVTHLDQKWMNAWIAIGQIATAQIAIAWHLQR